MFGKFWKDESKGSNRGREKQDAERSPIESPWENLAETPQGVPGDRPDVGRPSVTSTPQTDPILGSPTGAHDPAPPRHEPRDAPHREAAVLSDLLATLREYRRLRQPADDDEDFPGLVIDGIDLSSEVEFGGPESDDSAQPSPPPTGSAQPHSSPTGDAETPPPSDGIPIPATFPLPGPFRRRTKGRRLAKPATTTRTVVSPTQRLLLLDTWNRSGLSAADFASLVGVSKHTLYKWKKQFTQFGPEGLMNQPRNHAARGATKVSELTQRTILMMKQANPDWGCQRISDMLSRGPALPATASTVSQVLKEAGYELVEEKARRHRPTIRRFERAKPNQLWQTDLFTFVLKRQNRRLYLVAFMDDHSRFIVSFGLAASATTAQVIEILEAGIASHGAPEEVLTDNGPQYVTWRGKSRFTKHLEKRGIRQIIARPKRPQTLGKIERFWGTLWREFLEAAIFTDLEDARRRIAHFIDYYNFSRVHRGIDGLVPADRFFHAAPDVLRTLKECVAANALQLARHGEAKQPFYVTGRVDGQSFSVHSEGHRLILRRDGEDRQEVELTSPIPTANSQEPGESPRPLCADGSLPSRAGEPAEQPPPLPGESVIPLKPDDNARDHNDRSEDETGGDA